MALTPMRLERLRLRQRDGVTCGPTVAIVAAALCSPDYAARLAGPDGPGWFVDEQGRLHRSLNRWWPRALGTTPVGMVRALRGHAPVPYRWRRARLRRDPLLDVREAVLTGHPVPMLVGRFIPRHWVLLIDAPDTAGFRCYEPSSGNITRVATAQIRKGRLRSTGYPRAFAFVLPRRFW